MILSRSLLAGLLCGVALAGAGAASAETDLTVVMSGLAKGELVVTDDGSGARKIVYHFMDRGRGPDLTTVRTVDASGAPVTLSVDGVDYRKVAIHERFSAEAGQAHWTSDADEGQARAGGFYLPSQSSPEDTAALARALLASPNHEFDLLPAGHATLVRAAELDVTGTPGPAKAILYLIGGLDLEPAAVWLDEKGELFASGGGWLAVVRKGYETAQPQFFAAQDRALAESASARAAGLAHRPTGPVLIRHATVFDAEARQMRPGWSVLIQGDRIAAVGPDARVNAPTAAQIIDAHGQTLLPGLWDMHVHIQGQQDGLLDLMVGVTTVRDMGDDMAPLKALSDSFDSGALTGPRVLKAGLIDGAGPFAGPTKVLVSTPEEMLAAVDRFADAGYPQIKLYSSVNPALVPVGIAEARRRGMRVSGHVPAGMSMRQAVEAGYDEVQHANFWMLNFMSPEIQARTNTPARFTDVLEHGRDIDVASPEVRDFIAFLKAHNTVLDPTLVTFEPMFTAVRGVPGPWLAPWADRLPARMLRGDLVGSRAKDAAQHAAFVESYLRMKQMLKAMHDAGIQMVEGTDGSAMDYTRELELHVESGVPAADVLYEATLGSARVMKLDREVGSITVGKRADLVLIDGDLLARMGEVRRTRLVIKGGLLYDPAALARAAGLAPERGAPPSLLPH